MKLKFMETINQSTRLVSRLKFSHSRILFFPRIFRIIFIKQFFCCFFGVGANLFGIIMFFPLFVCSFHASELSTLAKKNKAELRNRFVHTIIVGRRTGGVVQGQWNIILWEIQFNLVLSEKFVLFFLHNSPPPHWETRAKEKPKNFFISIFVFFSRRYKNHFCVWE